MAVANTAATSTALEKNTSKIEATKRPPRGVTRQPQLGGVTKQPRLRGLTKLPPSEVIVQRQSEATTLLRAKVTATSRQPREATKQLPGGVTNLQPQ